MNKSQWIMTQDGELMHYGVIGMKWGVRRGNTAKAYEKASKASYKAVKKAQKAQKWYSKMEKTFSKTDISLTKDQQALGKKYMDMMNERAASRY